MQGYSLWIHFYGNWTAILLHRWDQMQQQQHIHYGLNKCLCLACDNINKLLQGDEDFVTNTEYTALLHFNKYT